MGIFSEIFGTGTVIEKGLELIDDAWTSDEEQAEIDAQAIERKAQSKIELLKAYAPFKLTQRVIAFAFTGVFLFIMVNGVLGSLYGWIDLEKVQNAMEFANKMWLGEIMIAIVTFYFGGGFAESIKRKPTGGGS